MTCATQPAFPATDTMIQRMLTSALFAGCAVGLLAALLHFAFVQKYVLLGELYETGAVTHFSSGSASETASSAPDPAPESAHDHANPGQHADGLAHEAHAHGPSPSDMTRNAYTVLFTVLVYSAYALILVAGFGLAESFGPKIGAAEGMLWGLAGFASFQMAPAMGLAPELPGTIAADLGARQLWWWGTVAATASALALIGYGRKPWAILLAAILLAAPHLIGAPQIDAYSGVAPPEVAAAFSANVLGVGLMVWLCLGWVAGALWQRSTL